MSQPLVNSSRHRNLYLYSCRSIQQTIRSQMPLEGVLSEGIYDRTKLTPMDFELQNELRDDVNHGERLLWAGRPKTGVIFRPSDTFLIPFSIVWFGFAVFWESMAILTGSPLFIVFGIPFILIGFYICIGRFFADSLRRKKTIYGITTERVIIKSGVFNKQTRSINIKNITDFALTEKPDGSGTIMFGSSPAQSLVVFNTLGAWQGSRLVNGIEFVPDAKKVYNIIVDAQKDS